MKKKNLFIGELERRRSTSTLLFDIAPMQVNETVPNGSSLDNRKWIKPAQNADPANNGIVINSAVIDPSDVRSAPAAQGVDTTSELAKNREKLIQEFAAIRNKIVEFVRNILEKIQTLIKDFLKLLTGDKSSGSSTTPSETATTLALGEEGEVPKPGPVVSTMAIGEEGEVPKPGPVVSTMAIGEEGITNK